VAVCGGNSGQEILPWSCRALSSPRDRRLNHRRHHQSSALILTLEGMMAATRQLTDDHNHWCRVVASPSREVFGIDVSRGMLRQGAAYVAQEGVSNMCHRSLQNQPVEVKSKPATLNWEFHNRFKG
jgi:hypothetical protein